MTTILQINPSAVLYSQLKALGALFLLNLVSLFTKNYVTLNGIKSYTIDTYVIKMFGFFNEHNIPTYFSTINLFLCAGLLFCIHRIVKERNTSTHHKQWLLLSRIFVLLALDEVLMIHEMFITPSRYLINHFFEVESWGILYHTWVVPYVGLTLFFVFYFYKFVFSLPKKFIQRFALAGFLFVSGAIGLEMIEGSLAEFLGESVYKSDMTFMCWVAAEETLEMISIILFIHSLLVYMETQMNSSDLYITINSKKIDVTHALNKANNVLVS